MEISRLGRGVAASWLQDEDRDRTGRICEEAAEGIRGDGEEKRNAQRVYQNTQRSVF